jgi:hypothetical protein
LKQHFLSYINEIIFIERKNYFSRADVVLYHPGHFPELNQYVSDLYQREGFSRLLIPSLHNQFINQNEYEFHKEKLLNLGIPEGKIQPIVGEHKTVMEVVHNAFNLIEKGETNILLAGKAFFCKRFLLLASLYSTEDQIIDVYPLLDDRGIDENKWFTSEKGFQRVLNEIKQISSIIEGSSRELKDFT